MLHLICFRTFIFSTWVWSVSLRGFLLYCRVLHYFARSLAGKKIFSFMFFAPSCYGNVFTYLFCCQRLTKFETTDTCVSICLHWFVPIFHSWVFVFPVFGLGLIFYTRPQILVAAWFCLQPNSSLACRQMNITVSHSALTVSVFVKTRRVLKCRMF